MASWPSSKTWPTGKAWAIGKSWPTGYSWPGGGSSFRPWVDIPNWVEWMESDYGIQTISASVLDPSDLNTGNWTATGAPTRTPNSGGSGKTLITATGSVATHVRQTPSNFSANGLDYPWTVDFTASVGAGWVFIEFFAAAGGRIWVNVSTGAIGTTGVNLTSASMTSLGGGEWRLSVRSPTGANEIRIGLASADNSLTATAADAVLVRNVTVYQTRLTGFTNKVSGVVSTEATAANQPLVDNSWGGLPCIQFGSQQRVFVTEAAVVNALKDAPAYTMVMVVEPAVKDAAGCFVGAGNSGIATNRTKVWGQSATGSGKFTANYINDAAGTQTSETTDDMQGTPGTQSGRHILIWRSTGAVEDAILDGEPCSISVTAVTPGVVTINRIALGARPDSVPDTFGNFRIVCWAVNTRRITNTEAQQVDAYLKNKWATTRARPYYPINPALIDLGYWTSADLPAVNDGAAMTSWPARIGSVPLTGTSVTVSSSGYTRPDGTPVRSVALNGTTGYLSADALAASFTGANPAVTVIVVYQPTSSVVDETIFSVSSTTTTEKIALLHNAADAFTWVQNATFSNFAYGKSYGGTGSRKAVALRSSGTTADLVHDMVRDQTGPLANAVAAQTTLNKVTIGARTNGSGVYVNFAAMRVVAVIMTTQQLTDAQIDEIILHESGHFDGIPYYTTATTFTIVTGDGQSNEVGRDTGSGAPAYSPPSSVRYWADTDRRTSTALTAVLPNSDNSVGPWYNCAYTLANAGQTVHMAVAGTGATTIGNHLQQNDPTAGLFGAWKRAALRCRARLGGTILGYNGFGASRAIGHTVRWALTTAIGESDGMSAPLAANFASNLAIWATDARTALGVNTKIYHQILNSHVNDVVPGTVPELVTINAAFATADAGDALMYLVDPNSAGALTEASGDILADHIHHSNAGQQKIGALLAAAILANPP